MYYQEDAKKGMNVSGPPTSQSTIPVKQRYGINLSSSQEKMQAWRESENNQDEVGTIRKEIQETTHFNPKFGSIQKGFSQSSAAQTRYQRVASHEFPGFGGAFMLRAPPEMIAKVEESQRVRESKPKLGEWHTTAICGNDILSSVLYVSGVVTSQAGLLSPVCLVVVSGILFLMRFVYSEAITALPMNGGSYHILVNTTSKPLASLAACLAIISYIATAVVSGTSAINYLQALFPSIEVISSTIILLFVFAVLAFIGISESSQVALVMFIAHIFTLSALVLSALYCVYCDRSIWISNWSSWTYPDVTVGGGIVSGTFFTAITFGVATAMLGVSGFESAAQYVQEQEPGVFAKCLRNMWIAVAFFNPLISLLSFCVLTLEEIQEHTNDVLASMAYSVGSKLEGLLHSSLPLGNIFTTCMAVDAFIVLAGAVLTAYVGVGGLIGRLAADQVLPQFLLSKNQWRGTRHYIIFGFFFLCLSQVLVLQGDVVSLSGVYTFAFLGVMSIFTTGTILLKAKRRRLPREVTAPWAFCIMALILLLCCLLANIINKPAILSYFFLYCSGVGLCILLMFQRLRISTLIMLALRKFFGEENARWARQWKTKLQESPYVFFCKYDDLYQINKAILYVRMNEVTNHLIIVHVCSTDQSEPDELPAHIEMFDAMYPKLKISLLTVIGEFKPALIEWLSGQLQIPQNMMFITCPDDEFKFKISSLGGVRVITH